MSHFAAYQESIAELCKSLRVAELDLFGSVARGQETPESDVDAAVVFVGSDDLFNRFMDLKEGLERIFSRPVDLLTRSSIRNPILKEEFEKDHVVIYAA